MSVPDPNTPEYAGLARAFPGRQNGAAHDAEGILVSRLAPSKEQTRNERRRDPRPDAFALTTLAQLLAEPDEAVEWAVEGLLLAGGTSALGAKPKVGKTTLTRNVVVSVASGTEVLGRATRPGPVVYVALEEKRSRVREHFRRLLAELPEPDDEVAPVWVHTGMAPRDALAALEDAVVAHGAVLAVCDPILKLIRVRDANDYAEVSDAFEPWTALARATGCHLMAVHHFGKADRVGGDAFLGSTAIFGAVDTALLLRRQPDGRRTLETVQRYGDDLPESVLALEADTGRVALGGEVTVLQEEAAEARVLAVLAGAAKATPDGGTVRWTEQELRQQAGGDTAAVAKAIRRLVEAQQLVREGTGRRGDPYRYGAPPAPEEAP